MLFAGTIAENMCFGLEDAVIRGMSPETERLVEQAGREANVYEFVSRFKGVILPRGRGFQCGSSTTGRVQMATRQWWASEAFVCLGGRSSVWPLRAPCW